ncbi:MAG: hypothetical protein IVW56_06335 [Candidatus Binataceae bacterium]|nr:hypothetical protein [Candidatus Binataceae bacterium]
MGRGTLCRIRHQYAAEDLEEEERLRVVRDARPARGESAANAWMAQGRIRFPINSSPAASCPFVI